MAEDYIKLHKSIVDSDIYKVPPLYLRVFERLILEAYHGLRVIPYGTGKKAILRGECLTTLRTIAEWVSWYERGQIVTPNVKTIKTILDWLVEQEMISIYDLGNRKETHYKVLNYEVYQGEEASESNSLETVWKQAEYPPREAKKPINHPDSTQEVLTHWNLRGIVNHPRITPHMKIAIDLAAKKFPLESIKTAIDHYAEMYNDATYTYCEYRWTLERFLDDAKGVAFFMDDGQKWINYLQHKKKTQAAAKKKDHDPYEIKRSWEV